MNPSIAVIQYRILHLQVEENLKRIESAIACAKKKGANIAVLPEDCITSSIFGDLAKLDTTHHARDAFQVLAKKYSIDIVTGSVMEGSNKGNFNTSYYIDAAGTVLNTYHKNNLYISERKFLSPGSECSVFDTAFGKAAIVICWDMLSPNLFQNLKSQGVQLIYCPSFWFREIADTIPGRSRYSEEKLIDALCLTRSVETNAALIYCNAAGTTNYPNSTRDTCIGHSQIVMPGRGVIKKLNHNHQGMFIRTLDLSILDASKKIYHA